MHSGYVDKTELNNFDNYIWLQSADSVAKQSGADTTFDAALKKVIDHQLTLIGFINHISQPCLIVRYHLVLRDDAIIRPPDGENRSPYWLQDQAEIYRFLKSTLIIDLVDSKSGNIVWWGVATEVISEDSDDLTYKQIETIVRKYSKRFQAVRSIHCDLDCAQARHHKELPYSDFYL